VKITVNYLGDSNNLGATRSKRIKLH